MCNIIKQKSFSAFLIFTNSFTQKRIRQRTAYYKTTNCSFFQSLIEALGGYLLRLEVQL